MKCVQLLWTTWSEVCNLIPTIGTKYIGGYGEHDSIQLHDYAGAHRVVAREGDWILVEDKP